MFSTQCVLPNLLPEKARSNELRCVIPWRLASLDCLGTHGAQQGHSFQDSPWGLDHPGNQKKDCLLSTWANSFRPEWKPSGTSSSPPENYDGCGLFVPKQRITNILMVMTRNVVVLTHLGTFFARWSRQTLLSRRPWWPRVTSVPSLSSLSSFALKETMHTCISNLEITKNLFGHHVLGLTCGPTTPVGPGSPVFPWNPCMTKWDGHIGQISKANINEPTELPRFHALASSHITIYYNYIFRYIYKILLASEKHFLSDSLAPPFVLDDLAARLFLEVPKKDGNSSEQKHTDPLREGCCYNDA